MNSTLVHTHISTIVYSLFIYFLFSFFFFFFFFLGWGGAGGVGGVSACESSQRLCTHVNTLGVGWRGQYF